MLPLSLRCGRLRPAGASLRSLSSLSSQRSARSEIGLGPDGRLQAPVLYTPGPLTLSRSTKEAMLLDLGSRDSRFLRVVSEVRSQLLAMAGSASPQHECVIMQGSGTFGVEAVLGSAVPHREQGGKLLVAINGAYGERMLKMAQVLGIATAEPVRSHESRALRSEDIVRACAADPGISHVAVVHHETTAGVLNNIHEIGTALAALPRPPAFIVDSMSAFGAYPVSLAASSISFLVSSSNKCIESVPGFSYALCEAKALKACAAVAPRSLSLDLHGQFAALQATGQFRFTPPTHSLLAFHQALKEHAEEGGAAGRLARYKANVAVLLQGMAELGFQPYVAPAESAAIITTFLVPEDPAFNFSAAYAALSARGCVVYPGKTTVAESFRIGSIGRIYEQDMRQVVQDLKEVLLEQGVALPVKQRQNLQEKNLNKQLQFYLHKL
jgi:2-aminoethylphosphonate-pyruvate transaminase